MTSSYTLIMGGQIYPPPEMWSLAWWDQIAPLVQAVVVIITAGIAVFSLFAWRRQMLGKRKAELAEEVLTSFYEVRDVFQWVRSRVIMSGEGKSRKSREGESEGSRPTGDTYSIPIERLRRERELFAKLQAQRYTFRAYFGNDSTEPFDVLFQAHQKIMTAAGVLRELAVFGMTTAAEPRPQDDLLNDLGWGRADRPDDIDRAIDAAVADIERFCKPILIGKRS